MKETMTTNMETDKTQWHSLDTTEALKLVSATTDGLTSDEAAKRLEKFGRNELPEVRPTSWLILFAGQFANFLIILLLGAAVLSVILADIHDAVFILIVVLINTVVGTIQEGRAERSTLALRKLVRHQATALRDGTLRHVEAYELVPGDIIALESGEQIPADARLISTIEFSVNESLLTGESEPVLKDAGLILAANSSMGERRNMIFAGSLVNHGRARALVVATALQTELGLIAQEIGLKPSPPAPLVARLHNFGRIMGLSILALVGILGVIQWLVGIPIKDVIFGAIALAVSAIPEGLPMAITAALAIAAYRMARRNVIVRELPAVEGLGACTLIASDKTGTLTKNELSVRSIWLPDTDYIDLQKTVVDAASSKTLGQFISSAAICNEARLIKEDGEVKAEGDNVDIAILRFADGHNINRLHLLGQTPEVGAIAYEAQNRFSAVFTRTNDGRIIAHVKGALETLLEMCNGTDPKAAEAAERMASKSFRIIAVARGEVKNPDRNSLTGLTLLGLIGLQDPVRPEVPSAVIAAQKAGLRVCMVTGDHPTTALSIARELNICHEMEEVVTGKQIASLEGKELSDVIRHAKVFARVDPMQKLTIVKELQAAGHFVAVTGDGVNDAPALHAAEIGVAMGKSGTDVARLASDLVITDDNFASIVAGVSEGRIAYDNIRKVITFLLSTSVAEIALFVFSTTLGLPIPLFAVQLLWLNIVTDSIQHIALLLDRDEAAAIARGPRPPKEPLLSRTMIEQVVLAGVAMAFIGTLMFWWLLNNGYSESAARNLLLLSIICFENAQVFNCRSEKGSLFRQSLLTNPWVLGVILITQALHIGAMYTPWLERVLELSPISIKEWLAVAAMTSIVIVVIEVYKFIKFSYLKHKA